MTNPTGEAVHSQEHLLNQAVRDIEISGIRRFAQKVTEFPDAISLTLGQPDFPTPEHIRQAGQTAISTHRTTYTPNAGLLELRIAASQYIQNKYQMTYHPDTEILVTVGVAHALDITLRTIVSPGDEVILPAPIYPGYEPILRMCGATPVYVDTRKTGFVLTADALLQAITEKTKAVILPYPSNPTGCILRPKDLAELADVLRNRDIFVVSDEIYSELVYTGRHMSIATMPGMREKTIVINGLSKSHAMTGWRIGFTFAPPEITQHLVKVLQYSATCATSISQVAGIEALTAGANDAEAMRVAYLERRDFLLFRLRQMGFEVATPEGAFYVFPAIHPWQFSSLDFATRLLEEGGVAGVPGDAFSVYGEGYIRFSYAYAMPILAEAMNRIEAFLHSIRQTTR
jgi:aminotransferase